MGFNLSEYASGVIPTGTNNEILKELPHPQQNRKSNSNESYGMVMWGNDILKPSNITFDSIVEAILEYESENKNGVKIFEGKCEIGKELDLKLSEIKGSEHINKKDMIFLLTKAIEIFKEKSWYNFKEFED